MKKEYLFWIISVWVVIIMGSFTFNYITSFDSNKKLILNESRAFFEHILVARKWNADHGGVYAPITDRTQPNQYLNDSLRDIVTTKGLKLTKINPAYMTRQIAEIGNDSSGIKYRITSLNPIRPENMADSWETKALTSLEAGRNEYYEYTSQNGEKVFRYMAPLAIQNSCLDCHSIQGYKIGDIKGGISISSLATTHMSLANLQLIRLAFLHATFLVLGIMGIAMFYKKTNNYFNELEIKNLQLKNLNQTKDKIFSIIAHDLKNPLSSIYGISSLLVNNSLEIENEKKSFLLNTISSTSQITVNLLDNLLEWAKTQTGRLNFSPQTVKLTLTIEHIIEIVTPAANLKKISIFNNVDYTTTIFADKNMLDTILRNLISNAIKFTHTNGEILVNAVHNASQTIVTISDNGVGMDKETISKLFRLNGGFTSTGTENETGSGLGLALCRDFVELHGGSIWVKSEVGKGSSFSFALPNGIN